jgi:hypothetical protein
MHDSVSARRRIGRLIRGGDDLGRVTPQGGVRYLNAADQVRGPGQARVHPRGAAGVRPCRRPGPRARLQGLAAGVAGRDAVQDRLRLRAAPQRGPAPAHVRFRAQPARPRVRPLRQGAQGIGADAAHRADRVRLVGRGDRALGRAGSAPIHGEGLDLFPNERGGLVSEVALGAGSGAIVRSRLVTNDGPKQYQIAVQTSIPRWSKTVSLRL